MEVAFRATAAAGSLQSTVEAVAVLPHRWTQGGVAVDVECSGAHLLHLATAVCVLNDLYREAAARGVELAGVRVTAAGGCDEGSWTSTGITYATDVDAALPQAELQALLEAVDAVAEIPRALRAGAPVRRTAHGA